jgi:hypothetical protein
MRRLLVLAAIPLAFVSAAPAVAAAPQVTMDPVGDLGLAGRSVDLSGTYRCDPILVPGGAETVYLQVTQGFAKAQGSTRVYCDGASHAYAATLPVVSVASLVPGSALGQATIAGSAGSGNNAPGQGMTLIP